MGTRSRAARSKGLVSAVALGTVLALALAGCQKLFTTSLAESMARDGASIPSDLSVGEARDLVDQIRDSGDVDLAEDLLSALVDEIADTKDAGKKEELKAAAAASAVVACDVTSDLTSLVNSYADGSAPSSAALIALSESIKDKASADILAGCAYLDPTTGVSDPAAVELSLSATEYAVAAIILMASVTPDGEDPSTFNYATLTGDDADTVDEASRIIGQAKTMVEPGSESYELLQSLSEKFSLM